MTESLSEPITSSLPSPFAPPPSEPRWRAAEAPMAGALEPDAIEPDAIEPNAIESVVHSEPTRAIAPALTPLPEERSSPLSDLFHDGTPRGTALRAGAGLLATLPFALAAGHASRADLLTVVGGMLSIPVSLAIIALVGMAASTIGVSLLSSPLSPAEAADVGARGILRTGLVLFGLSPITALWVASYGGGDALIVPTLAWGVAGILGTSTLNAHFVAAVHPQRTPALGTIVVMGLLTLFMVVVGIRMWLGAADAFHAVSAPAVAVGGAA
jgi:hypothetical protein